MRTNSMKSLPYRIPQLYERGITLLLGNTLSLRYERIAEEIGSNKKVLELGCGPALLHPYLHSCDYTGWDLNDYFVKYCQKKGLNVYKKDIFQFSEYPQTDYIVFCDILHHVIPRDELLLKEATKRAPVIAVEPCSQRRLPTPLLYLYDQLLGDADGINPFKTRMSWNYNQTTLTQKFQTLGATTLELLDSHLFAVFPSQFLNR